MGPPASPARAPERDRQPPPGGDPVGRLRVIGKAEGSSFLVLLGVAMPLKYLAGRPEAVQVVGWIHGILFVLYVAALASARSARGWDLARTARLFVAAFLPFGPFVADASLAREQTTDRGDDEGAPGSA